MSLIITFLLFIIVVVLISRSISSILQSWGDRLLIKRAVWLASDLPLSRKKIEKCIKKLGPVATRDKEADEWREHLKKLLREEF